MIGQTMPGLELSRRALLAGGVATLGGCDVSGIPQDRRRLVMVVPQEISLLDPAVTLAVADLGASQAAYQRLPATIALIMANERERVPSSSLELWTFRKVHAMRL